MTHTIRLSVVYGYSPHRARSGAVRVTLPDGISPSRARRYALQGPSQITDAIYRGGPYLLLRPVNLSGYTVVATVWAATPRAGDSDEPGEV